MDRILVYVDAELEEIVPSYLEAKTADMRRIRDAVARGDLETVRLAGHSLKGSGSGYGFDALSEMGRRIELAAVNGDTAAVLAAAAEVETYVSSVDVAYRPEEA